MAQRTTVPIDTIRHHVTSPNWVADLTTAFGTQIPIEVPDITDPSGWSDDRGTVRLRVPYRQCERSTAFPDGWLYQSLDIPLADLVTAAPTVEVPPEDTAYLDYYAAKAAEARSLGIVTLDDPNLPPSRRVLRRLTMLLDNPDYARLQHRREWLPTIVASYHYYLHDAATLNGAQSFGAAGEMMGVADIFKRLVGRKLDTQTDTITVDDLGDLTAWEQRIRSR